MFCLKYQPYQSNTKKGCEKRKESLLKAATFITPSHVMKKGDFVLLDNPIDSVLYMHLRSQEARMGSTYSSHCTWGNNASLSCAKHHVSFASLVRNAYLYFSAFPICHPIHFNQNHSQKRKAGAYSPTSSLLPIL